MRDWIGSLFCCCSRAVVAEPDLQVQPPLHVAASAGGILTALSLLALGTKINQQNQGGSTALHCAAESGQLQMVNLLIGFKIKVDHKNAFGVTALHAAAYFGYSEVAKALLAADADFDLEYQDGETPLCVASEDGHVDIVRILLAAGADPTKVTSKGHRPLDLAVEKRRWDVVRLFSQNKEIEGIDTSAVMRELVESNQMSCILRLDARPGPTSVISPLERYVTAAGNELAAAIPSRHAQARHRNRPWPFAPCPHTCLEPPWLAYEQ